MQVSRVVGKPTSLLCQLCNQILTPCVDHALRVKHPPGEEIYRNGNVCMFEVGGVGGVPGKQGRPAWAFPPPAALHIAPPLACSPTDKKASSPLCAQVDGKKEKIFSQNLCYMAKLFLDHKTL